MKALRFKALEREILNTAQNLRQAEDQRDRNSTALKRAEGQILSLRNQVVSLNREIEILKNTAEKEVQRLKDLIETERLEAKEKLKQVVRKKRIKVTDL